MKYAQLTCAGLNDVLKNRSIKLSSGLSLVDNIYDKFVIESLIFRAEDLFT